MSQHKILDLALAKDLSTMNNKTDYDPFNQPIFFGEPVGIARFDRQKHRFFDKLTERQLAYFWRPEEVDMGSGKREYMELAEHEQHIFTSNLKYQTLMDSIQGRAITSVLAPLTSLPEVENWFQTWAFSETIHSRSYTHIIRSVMPDPSAMMDSIIATKEIRERSYSITKDYDVLYNAQHDSSVTMYQMKEYLLNALVTAYALEAIRFYVSFACTFAFGERGSMEGNAKIVKLIARDELLHKTGTKYIINLLVGGSETDSEYKEIWTKNQPHYRSIFQKVAEEEVAWIQYLFKDGELIGLNRQITTDYLMYIVNDSMKTINLPPLINREIKNPLTWMRNWLSSDNVQPAPQETEISSYLTGQVNTDVDVGDMGDYF